MTSANLNRQRTNKCGSSRMTPFVALLGLMLSAGVGTAQSLNCSLRDYKSIEGVDAAASGKGVSLSWPGENGLNSART
jgi:hypothetical protein